MPSLQENFLTQGLDTGAELWKQRAVQEEEAERRRCLAESQVNL